MHSEDQAPESPQQRYQRLKAENLEVRRHFTFECKRVENDPLISRNSLNSWAAELERVHREFLDAAAAIGKFPSVGDGIW